MSVSAVARRFLVPGIAVLSASAWAAGASPLEQRAGEVASLIQADPPAIHSLFTPAFLGRVDAEQLRGVFRMYFDQIGTCQVVEHAEPALPDARAGRFTFECSRGYSLPVELKVSADPPHLIEELLLKVPVAKATPGPASLNKAIEALAALPGTTALAVARLGDDDGVEPITEVQAGRAMAIGSVFKLYVLSALMGEIQASHRHWADVFRLPAKALSLPSGELQRWPAGAPLTLYTLAAQSISKSDNTATDALIAMLGRERVEAAVAEAGSRSVSLNQPFLTTREFFLLKQSPELAARFVAGDSAQRRALADGEMAAMALAPDSQAIWPAERAPGVEWFASMSDVVRLLAHLKAQSQRGEASEGRGLLAIQVPSSFAGPGWRYLGYKGGAEPGVLALAFLGQARSGRWYAVASAWNHTQNQPPPAYQTAIAQVLASLE